MVCFSYGVVIREMLTREFPQTVLAEGALMHKAFSGKLTHSVREYIPRAFKELLCGKFTLKI